MQQVILILHSCLGHPAYHIKVTHVTLGHPAGHIKVTYITLGHPACYITKGHTLQHEVPPGHT